MNEDLNAGVDDKKVDHAGVVAPPPLIYLCSILFGLGFNTLWPVEVFPQAVEFPFGMFIVLVAVIIFIFSVRRFLKADTPLRPNKPTVFIVRTGPYRYSRNPIYLSMTVLQIGIGIWADNVWILGMLIPALILISYGVIAREESYLENKFGEEYIKYKMSVRRWL